MNKNKLMVELLPRCTPKAVELFKKGLFGAIRVCAVVDDGSDQLKETKETLKKYIITLYGCDDITNIPMYLDEKQLKLIEALCKKSEECSEYGCMPTMGVEEYKDENNNEYVFERWWDEK